MYRFVAAYCGFLDFLVVMLHQPAHCQIQATAPSVFVTGFGWTNDSEGNVCPVLHARFELPEIGKIDAYAKALDLSNLDGRVSCLNELTGWLLAKASGLPVAERAFFAWIDATATPPFAGTGSLPAPSVSGSRLYFCTQEITRSHARGIVATDQLVDEQACWSSVHAAIAFDEMIANADRHLNNLVRRAPGDFVLIDHGRLLYRDAEPCWAVDELESLEPHSFPNLLHHHTYPCRGIFSPGDCSDGFELSRDSAEKHAQNATKAFFEIAFWCSQIFPGASSSWLHFLRRRGAGFEALLSKRFGVLPVTTNHAGPAKTS